MRLKYFTIVALTGCCCRFFISVGLSILLAATVLIIMDGTNLYMFISIGHKTQCLWVCRWIPLNGYGTLLIFEMMWYATVSNWAHIFFCVCGASHVHANALSYYHFVLPRFGLFFYYPARCTSFFGDLKWFVCNYFRQHDQIFLKFRTDDDQFVNKQEEIKTRRKGEIEKDINHICMFQIYLIRLWNDKISLLNFAKNKIQFGKWMHSLFL